METVKVGDAVVLNSGGPSMTVTEVYDNGINCECVWFDEGQLHTTVFPVALPSRW